MKLRSTLFIALLAVLVVGCKGSDAPSASADNSKPAGATAPDTTKPADTAGADASKAPDASGNTVVGTWTNDNKGMKDGVIEFKDDGSMSINGTADEKGTTVEITGTYKVDGDKITMHTTGQTLTAGANADDATKKSIDEANKASEEQLKGHPDDVATVKWTDKDTFVMTGSNGTPITFKRKT